MVTEGFLKKKNTHQSKNPTQSDTITPLSETVVYWKAGDKKISAEKFMDPIKAALVFSFIFFTNCICLIQQCHLRH